VWLFVPQVPTTTAIPASPVSLAISGTEVAVSSGADWDRFGTILLLLAYVQADRAGMVKVALPAPMVRFGTVRLTLAAAQLGLIGMDLYA
jgi:hypothetical protein